MDDLKQQCVNKIDKVIYINLRKRTDRDEHMKQITSIFGDKVERFEAIEYDPGFVGCSMSHLKVMEMAIKSDWKNLLVLEDDVLWNNNETAFKRFLSLVSQPYDAILLGGYKINCSRNFKLKSADGTHAYLVNHSHFTSLYNHFKEGLELFMSTAPKYDNGYYFIDQYWTKQIKQSNWFVVLPSIFYQKNDYSDITQNTRHIESWGYFTDVKPFDSNIIKKAEWGFGVNTIDVTDSIKDLYFPTFTPCHKLFNIDPSPGDTKILIIEYYDGSIQIGKEHTQMELRERF